MLFEDIGGVSFMKKSLFRRVAIAILTAGFPAAALADLTGSVTLSTNTALSLDTGVTSSTGGDILWTGSQLSFQGSSKGGTLTALGVSGATGFAGVTQAVLQALESFASATPILSSALPAGTV